MIGKKSAEVTEIIDETHNVKTFRFLPEEKIEFKPGQFLNLYCVVDKEGVVRSYSIASSPLKDYFDLTIELVPHGKLTPHLFENVKIGDKLSFEKPKGKFHYTDDMKKIVLLTGGCGIAPMMSIIRYCTEKNLDTEMVLMYSAKTKKDIIYRKELHELNKKYSNFTLVETLTREEWDGCCGRIDENKIKEYVKDIQKNTYFLCGSLHFARHMASLLKELGVDRTKIKREVWV